jgi:diguanylate cyclase (GGDEF)-like protein
MNTGAYVGKAGPTSYPLAANEPDRLLCLQQLEILDTGTDPAFEHIVDLAKSIFDVPIVLVSLVDEHRQWFKARRGLEANETKRELAFCNYTILSDEILVVEDSHLDERFARNDLVTGSPEIRFYAGCPLEMQDDMNAGSLCIIDRIPRVLSDRERVQLRLLGNVAAALLKQYRSARKMRDLSVELARAADVVERQRQSLDAQKRLLDCASDLAKVGAWETDCVTGEMVWSDGMYMLHEVDRTFVPSAASLAQFYPPEEFRRLTRLVNESHRSHKPYVFEGQMITEKGNRRWVRVSGHVELRGGVAVRRYGMKQDITEEKAALEEVKRLAERDPLTGLRNRAQLMARLSDIKVRGNPVCLILLDLDGFKDINDTLGHAAGDECLREIARRLDTVSGERRLLARIGGDEFAIVIEGTVDLDEVDRIATKILDLVSAPLAFNGASFRCSTSIGIALHQGGDALDEVDLMSSADLALYSAKAEGRNRHRYFEPALQVVADERVKSIEAIDGALKAEELELHYQAKVCLLTGAVAGYEALLRWNSTEGVRGPSSFLPALEDPRLSAAIGEFVLRTALDQAAAWHEKGLQFGSIAINVVQSQLRDRRFADRLLEELKIRKLSPHHLQLEVTENVFLQRGSDVIFEVCSKLREAGVLIALDDFGTGFASLTHLLDFPLSIIKIDRTFIARLGTRSGVTGLVKAIADIGVSMELDLVAEGVENAEQADFLKAVGCRFAQGFYFHRPESATVIGRARLTSPFTSSRQLLRGYGPEDNNERNVR